jgi:hypothetical protein
MNHDIITAADGHEWDLVTDEQGRFVALLPQDEDAGPPLLGWHPDQTKAIPRQQWRIG